MSGRGHDNCSSPEEQLRSAQQSHVQQRACVTSDSLVVEPTDSARGLSAADPTLVALRPAVPLALVPLRRGDPGVDDEGDSAPLWLCLSERPGGVRAALLPLFPAALGASSGFRLRKMPPRDACCIREAVLAGGEGAPPIAAPRLRPRCLLGAPMPRPVTEGTSACSGQRPPHRKVPGAGTCGDHTHVALRCAPCGWPPQADMPLWTAQ